MRYAQLIMGPAGSGKSTYCSTIVKHCEVTNRQVHVINLDPAAEYFDYPVSVDIRELISVDDAMEDSELRFGPNGGLVFCLEYLLKNFEWLRENIGEDQDDSYYLLDCPGQIELYTHMDIMKNLVQLLQSWDFRICGVYLIDSQFMVEVHKFFSGVFSSLSTMVQLEISFVNILSKIDLLNATGRKQIGRYLELDADNLLAEFEDEDDSWGKRYHSLSRAIAQVIDDFSLVKLTPLNIKNEESIADVLFMVDDAMQYGEDVDVKTRDFEYPDRDDDDGRDDDC